MSVQGKPPGRLQGRVAAVTGTSSGLGAAIALAFAAEGCSASGLSHCVTLTHDRPHRYGTFQAPKLVFTHI
jgi:hypothetical protein